MVKKDVSCANVTGMNLVLFNSLSLLLFHEVAFVYLMQSDSYFGMDPKEAAALSGSIIFWSQPFGIVGDFLAGYVHDICGRRNTIFIGFMIASVVAASFPYVPTVWPWFLFLRIVMTLALSGPNNHPLIADYVKTRSRGLASAQTGLMAGMGVVTGMFLIFGSTQTLDYAISFGISGSFCFFLAIVLFFCIEDKRYEKKEEEGLNSQQKFVAKSK